MIIPVFMNNVHKNHTLYLKKKKFLLSAPLLMLRIYGQKINFAGAKDCLIWE